MDKLKMTTPDLAEKNYQALAKLFPNAVTEMKDEEGHIIRGIDADVLRSEIAAGVVEGPKERYQFVWPDKRASIRLANVPTTDTLRLEKEKSVGRDGASGSIDTENIYIEGDNLDALKILRETYLGKVKMIYIDPPYNTGNDFIYEDDFSQTADEYVENSGQTDEAGNRLVENTESNGRFHTDWLNMIYPRLKIARDFLTEDGAIFISIDEHEIDNCLKMLDEVFGRNNRIGVIIIKSNPRGSMAIGEVANLHEYLVIYAKSAVSVDIIGHKLTNNMESEYKYKDDIGNYRLLGLRMRGGFWRRSDRPNLYFPIFVDPDTGSVSLEKNLTYNEEVLPIQPSTMEDGTWRWSTEKIRENTNLLIGKKVKRGNDVIWDIYQKDYFDREGGRRTKAKSIWDSNDINYQNGASEMKSLFNDAVFDYSKPVYLLLQILEMMGLEDDDIVMDFFSGSATTAQATMQFNVSEKLSLRFIMIQLVEHCSESSKAFKAGYKTICDIGEERIRRAGKKIKEETGADIDYGFRVFKVDSSNMQDVFYVASEYKQSDMDLFESKFKLDRTPADLLIQVMLELGIPLSAKITEDEVAGKKILSVDDAYLIACFDENIDEDTVTRIAKQHPYYAVFNIKGRENDKERDALIANFDQIFETHSPDTRRKML